MKYKVIKQFLGGSKVGTVLEEQGQNANFLTDGAYVYSGVEIQLLLDGGYLEEHTGKWTPKEHEVYWYILGTGRVGDTVNTDGEWDKKTITFGNCYPTEEAATEARDAIAAFVKARQV